MNPWNIPETPAFWISNNMLRLLKSKSGSNIFFSLWIQICLRTKYSYPRQIEDIWIFSRAMVCQIWQIKIEDIQLNLNMNFRFKIISLNVLMQDLGHNDGKNLFALYLKFKVNWAPYTLSSNLTTLPCWATLALIGALRISILFIKQVLGAFSFLNIKEQSHWLLWILGVYGHFDFLFSNKLDPRCENRPWYIPYPCLFH